MKKKSGGQLARRAASCWYLILIALFFAGAIGLYAVCGEGAQIAVQDNLDLFQAQYQMLKNTDTFFAHGVASPFLGGVTRDDLPSELSFAGLLYFLLPSFTAYLTLYFSKILMAMAGMWLLAGEILPGGNAAGESQEGNSVCVRSKGRRPEGRGQKNGGLVLLAGFAYGILNLFPAFGMCFASIPLCIWLLLRVYRAGTVRRALPYLAGVFVYPFFSYFSYFGIFLCAYLLLAVVGMSVRDRRFCGRLFLALALLAAGSVVFEYRLFGQMLFSDTVTIRSTFVAGDLSGREILAQIADVWENGMMHVEDAHTTLVLPVCVLYFWYRNIRYAVQGKWRGIFHDLFNLMMALILFNCLIYGLYNWAPFRTLIETVLPPLEGWQFNRTVFFNPFLWYAAFFVVCGRIYRRGTVTVCGKDAAVRGTGKFWRGAAYALALASIAVILLTPSRYNDLYHTAYAKVYETVKGQKMGDLSYGEFYSTELFAQIKEDLQYEAGNFKESDDARTIHLSARAQGVSGQESGAAEVQGEQSVQGQNAARPEDSARAQWAVAYGLHPAVLEYNGIATLDGYLGFYAQSYKEAFREVIAPALDRMTTTAVYYDEWGARCYLYSGSEATIVQASRHYAPQDSGICIDTAALRRLGCRYLFSRIELTNAAQKELTLRGVYTEESSPYTIYVYEL
ncbi:MAG: DUF6044 family protein [Eubacteriales bacterium]|nr:DUF6044 family protein [Eubacteriales bacterium]